MTGKKKGLLICSSYFLVLCVDLGSFEKFYKNKEQMEYSLKVCMIPANLRLLIKGRC